MSMSKAEIIAALVNLLKDSDSDKTEKKPENKYFNNDGSPAKDISSSRENLIHVDEVKDAFNKLSSVNTIEKINDPSYVTKTVDEYGLTDNQRRWLLEYIFAVEGGYFNHPNDPGGETMYGIIKSEARKNGYDGPMKDLPKEVAVQIYLDKYWKKYKLDQIHDFKKALCIFDFLVNSGNRGIKVTQRTVNKIVNAKSKLSTTAEKYKNLRTLEVDGVIGNKTIAAINTIDFYEFTAVYFVLQEDTYEDLMRANSKLRSFDEGWENRMVVKALYLSELDKRERK